jgi:adenylylsulfate kinase
MVVGMESHRRSVVKALTWRVTATLVTTLVVYLFTRQVALAMGVGFVDAAIKILAYYLHERLWNRMNFGRRKEAREDYMI